MANREHLTILRQGVAAWNAWRKSYPQVRPNLRHAKLSGLLLEDIDFHDVDLFKADLSQANLQRADFLRANLFRASFFHANLTQARLLRADLTRADLRQAVLSAADLRDADLSQTEMRGARLNSAQLLGATLFQTDLANADLTEARTGWTVFGAVDLSHVDGLLAMKHEAPSTLGIDSVYLSQGRIPDAFLRGIGAPETFIPFAHSLVTPRNVNQFYSTFISYSTQDQAFADRLHADLQAAGVRCWFAAEDLKIGDPFRDTIYNAIRLHDKLLLILSEHSVASNWVADEVEKALADERRYSRRILFPIRLDDAVKDTSAAWAVHVRTTRHIGDFTGWKHHDAYQTAFARLLRDLQAPTSISDNNEAQ